MSEPVRKLLAETSITLHPDDFTLVSINRGEEGEARRLLGGLEPFSSVTFDLAEVSLVLRAEEWERLRGRFTDFVEEGPYRLITFEIVLDLSVVGFLAAVSSRLAEEGVSIYALSTFLRDHILVKGEDADRAAEALRRLIEECKAA
ncbi:MAG: ACT domain-containing protein [Candidatus Bathyarchaeia archaeon]